MRELLLKALVCENKGRKPVWIMRQAGRFLPEYRALREKHTLSEMFFDRDLIVKTTLLPIEAIDPDAAILFSDILIVAKMLGLHLTFEEGRGPVVSPLLRTKEDVIKLKNIPCLDFIGDAVSDLRCKLTVPLIGFCGGPFTVASYLIEEKHSHDLPLTKKWMYRDPKSFHLLLEKITEATLSYLAMLIEKGVQAVQIFESFAHVLSKTHLWEFSFPYMKRIAEFVKKKNLSVILFMRNSCLFAEDLASLSPDAISFDWQKPLFEMRRVLPRHIAIQGNFDPHLLFASQDTIRKTVREALQPMDQDPGYIVNLGHGILPETPVENVKCFIQTIREACE